jgi:hypothetical protein
VKYPKRIKYRGKVLATIYGRCKGRNSYRVAWQVAGQRHMASFASYSLAKRHADGLVKDLSKGSQVTALHPSQARSTGGDQFEHSENTRLTFFRDRFVAKMGLQMVN